MVVQVLVAVLVAVVVVVVMMVMMVGGVEMSKNYLCLPGCNHPPSLLGPLGNHSGDRMVTLLIVLKMMVKRKTLQEWDLENDAEKVLSKGIHLSEVYCY